MQALPRGDFSVIHSATPTSGLAHTVLCTWHWVGGGGCSSRSPACPTVIPRGYAGPGRSWKVTASPECLPSWSPAHHGSFSTLTLDPNPSGMSGYY